MTKTASLSFRPVAENEYDTLLAAMYEHAADYLEPSLMLLGIDKDRFAALFRETGSVYGIEKDGEAAGFYWIERRDTTLHIHALILYPAFRKQGLAKMALERIENTADLDVDVLELGVHESNARARGVFEKAGFRVTKHLEDLGFSIMRKSLLG